MLINLLMSVLPAVFVLYMLSCWFLEKKHRVGGFFVSWAAAAILAPMLADGRSWQAAMDKATLAGLIAVVIVVLLIAIVESLIYPHSVSENILPSDSSKNSSTLPSKPETSSELKATLVPANSGDNLEGHEPVNSANRSPWESDSSDSDEKIWEAAAEELNSNRRRIGLWAKVFAESNGDENRAKALYLRVRYSEMKTENPFRRGEI